MYLRSGRHRRGIASLGSFLPTSGCRQFSSPGVDFEHRAGGGIFVFSGFDGFTVAGTAITKETILLDLKELAQGRVSSTLQDSCRPTAERGLPH